jgi:phosphoketolase
VVRGQVLAAGVESFKAQQPAGHRLSRSRPRPRVPRAAGDGGGAQVPVCRDEGPYVLTHAYGAAFDNPDLVVAAVVGDGEAETGPLATSWHANKFLNPARDGAVLPILHLNGCKIANPTVLARISPEELHDLFRGYGYTPHFVEGSDPATMHQAFAATLDRCLDEIAGFQRRARDGAAASGRAGR